MTRLYIYFLFFFSLNFLFSQTINDLNESFKVLNDTGYKGSYIGFGSASDFEYTFCSEDGFSIINIGEIVNQVLIEGNYSHESSEAVIIGTSNGRIIKVSNLTSNPVVSLECNMETPLSDVAVDENGIYYATNFESIFKISTDCFRSSVPHIGFLNNVNSLSFDTQGNLYYGSVSSHVMRYNADESSPPYLWHDFVTGNAGGDFVMLGDKLYISWVVFGDNRLYEVTIDEDINYISHIDLGAIPAGTFGLASELGKLYGVTPSSLYEIDLTTMNTNTILTNSGNYGDWFGAAGIHESVAYSAAAYETSYDATHDIDPLSDIWQNTQMGGQTIYIRIENTFNGDFEITPVDIIIGTNPELSDPNDLNQCHDTINSFASFDLTNVEDVLLSSVGQNVITTYHSSHDDAVNSVFALPTNYMSITSPERIYVRVEDVVTGCYSTSEFDLITKYDVLLEPLEEYPQLRLLKNCYQDSNGDSYIFLESIYDQVLIDDYGSTVTVTFHASQNDAENNSNNLSSHYYGEYSLEPKELFVRVETEDGCYSITNFFVDTSCFIVDNDFSNIYFPKVFTPNNDGVNDYWNVKGLPADRLKASRIDIFNRYGKLLYSFSPWSDIGWNGSYNNTFLPNDDYWFVFIFVDLGNSYQGHFSLKR